MSVNFYLLADPFSGVLAEQISNDAVCFKHLQSVKPLITHNWVNCGFFNAATNDRNNVDNIDDDDDNDDDNDDDKCDGIYTNIIHKWTKRRNPKPVRVVRRIFFHYLARDYMSYV